MKYFSVVKSTEITSLKPIFNLKRDYQKNRAFCVLKNVINLYFLSKEEELIPEVKKY